METMKTFFKILCWIECSKEQHFFLEFFFFTVTFVQFNASLLNKIINFFKNQSYLSQTFWQYVCSVFSDETASRRFLCWKSPNTPTAAQIQCFLKTPGYLPLTRYQWACTHSLKFICQWSFTSAQKVKCVWQLFSLLSWFVRLIVKGWTVCGFSVSLCLLQSREEHHILASYKQLSLSTSSSTKPL